MGLKYSTQTASGFDASPPSDDGTAVSSNEVKWSFIKTKLASPVKDLADNMNTALLTHIDESVLDKAVTYTTTAADHKRTINVTAAATQSLGDAATMAAGYIVTVKNSHTAAITVDLATGADALDGTAAGSLSLEPDEAVTVAVNSSADGYLIKSSRSGNPKIKIIDIGDWNMDSTSAVAIAHGLTVTDIRSIQVMVRSDAGTLYSISHQQSGSSDHAAGTWASSATEVTCSRESNDFFDTTSFDSTSYNRGWITITYV